jgi:2-C-methyl-D-erythritol 4-phosphate cytidylyltransferase
VGVGVGVVLVAAGSGDRLGLAVPKAFVPICGRALLVHALESVGAVPSVDAVVVVAAAGEADRARALAAASRVGAPVSAVVSGGPTRQASVRLGLEAMDPDIEIVLCHDAARPFAGPDLFQRVIRALDRADGAVPVIRSSDTVKLLDDEGFVSRTVPRSQVGFAQTPQGFRAFVLRAVHADPPGGVEDATDDAVLLELAGHRVVAVEGDAANVKITTPEDLRRAEAFLRERTKEVPSP